MVEDWPITLSPSKNILPGFEGTLVAGGGTGVWRVGSGVIVGVEFANRCRAGSLHPTFWFPLLFFALPIYGRRCLWAGRTRERLLNWIRGRELAAEPHSLLASEAPRTLRATQLTASWKDWYWQHGCCWPHGCGWPQAESIFSPTLGGPFC